MRIFFLLFIILAVALSGIGDAHMAEGGSFKTATFALG